MSLVAETPAPPSKESKSFSANFAPFGRLIPCELIITVDSSSIQTPIIGLVTEDIFHHGQLIIPAGTEVHGSATVDRARERIASNGRWTLVWQNGEELNVSGLALDHEPDKETGGWGITDGSAGLRGRLIKTDNLAEVKLYVAALLSGAADVFTDRRISDFGSFALPSLQKRATQRCAERARPLCAANFTDHRTRRFLRSCAQPERSSTSTSRRLLTVQTQRLAAPQLTRRQRLSSLSPLRTLPAPRLCHRAHANPQQVGCTIRLINQ